MNSQGILQVSLAHPDMHDTSRYVHTTDGHPTRSSGNVICIVGQIGKENAVNIINRIIRMLDIIYIRDIKLVQQRNNEIYSPCRSEEDMRIDMRVKSAMRDREQ